MSETVTDYDIVLIGGGIMSATLAAMLARIEPGIRVQAFERLGAVALESSGPWNNAGTGHSALCELNYTTRQSDGSVDIAKAVAVNEQFQISRQFWASLVEEGHLGDEGADFINTVPHMSFIPGEEGGRYLAARQEALRANPLFASMQYSDDPARLDDWAPLLMAGRGRETAVAATFSAEGTDVDFGSLTRRLFWYARDAAGSELTVHTEVTGLTRRPNGSWVLSLRDRTTGSETVCSAGRVFIGAGGGTLRLLQASGIPEARDYAGFPISGKFLRCDEPGVVTRHNAKVYGQAAIGAPPMSVPHLDTRIIDGRTSLLFGPYAGFSPKFLKTGSWWDLPGSVRASNLGPMLSVARDNFGLEKYLAGELLRSSSSQFSALRDYYPEARESEWAMITAGQRVQVIKRRGRRGGVLQFGTELVVHSSGTLAGLLGASPGASTAVPVIIEVLRRCFPEQYRTWGEELRALIPSLGTRLSDDPQAARATLDRTAAILGLTR